MCGRPVFEPVTVPAVEAVPPPIPDSRPSIRLDQLPVSFSNPIALRVAFLMSLGVLLLTLIPIISMLLPLWWLGAGLNAVLLYRRLTGVSLSVGNGARLGSITGVLAFASLILLSALAMTFSGREFFQEMLKQNPDASQVLNNTPALILAVGLVILILFGMVVGICAAGGALGARVAGRNAKA
jgi:hypothetical protein